MFGDFFGAKNYTAEDLLTELLANELNIDKLNKILKSGISLSWHNEKSETFLHLCAYYNKPSSIQWLLKQRVEIDIETITGQTPLFYAVQNGSLESAELLISKSADIHHLDNKQRTILQEAVRNNQHKIVQYLLKFPNDVNNVDEKGKTVLFDAVATLNKEMILTVVNISSLDLNHKDFHGNTILFHDSVNVDSSVVKILIDKGIDVAVKNNEGIDYIFYCLLNRLLNQDILQRVMSLGYDINTKCEGQNLLMTLMQMKNPDVEMMQFLISKHIDVTAIDDNGETLLFKTVKNGDIINTKSFLERKIININHKDKQGNTVLVYAALKGKANINMVIELLKFGANPNIADIQGVTLIEKLIDSILHIQNKKKIASSLLQMIHKEEDYFYVLEKIIANSKVFLRKLNSKGKPLFFDSIFYSNKLLFTLLKNHGADINHKDEEGRNILHNLFLMSDSPIFKDQKGFQKLLHELIFYGADVNSKDQDGSTSVHSAILLTNNEHTVKVLLDSKANLKAQDNQGRSLVHNCVWDSKLKHFKLVHNYNENILNIPDKYGILPINYAAFIGHTDLVLEMITARSHVNNPHKKSDKMVDFFRKFAHNVYKLNNNVRDDFERKNIKMLIANMKKEFNLPEANML